MKRKHTASECKARRDSSYAACICTLLLFIALFGMVFICSKLYISRLKQEVSYVDDTHDSSAMKRDQTSSKNSIFETVSYRVTIHDLTSSEILTTASTNTMNKSLLNKSTFATTINEKVSDKSSKETRSMQSTLELISSTIRSPTVIKTKSKESRKSPKYSYTEKAVTQHKPLIIKTTLTIESPELVAHSSETSVPAEITTFTGESTRDISERSTDISTHLTEEPTEVDDTRVTPSRSQTSSESIATVTSEGNTYSHELRTDASESTYNSREVVTSPTLITERRPEDEVFSIDTSEPTTYLSQSSSLDSSTVDTPKKDLDETLKSTTILESSYSNLITTSKSITKEHESTAKTTKFYKKQFENRKIPARVSTTERFSSSVASKRVVSSNDSTTYNSALISKAKTSTTPVNNLEGAMIFDDGVEILAGANKTTYSSELFSKAKTSTTPVNNLEGAIIFEDDVELLAGANKTTKREQSIPFADLKITNETTSPATIHTSNCSNYCVVPTCPVCEVAHCPEILKSTLQPVTAPKPEPKVCRTSQCQVMASRILSLVNISVDPCEDFYSYACGGILNNPTLLEEDMATDVWNRIEEAVLNVTNKSPTSHRKFRNYYEGCLKYDSLVTMDSRREQGRSVLDSVALFLDSSSSSEDEFVELLIKFFRLGSAPLFRIQLDVDSVNSSRFQLVISPPDWLSSHFLTPEGKSQRCRHRAADSIPLNTQEAFTAYDNCMRNISDFLETTEKALEFFQIFNHLPPYNSSQLVQEIRMFMELDLLDLLSKYPPRSNIEKDKQFKNYKLWSKIKLDTEMPSISWSYLFSSLLNVEIQDTTNVQIYFSEQIMEFVNQLSTKNARTIQNLMLAVLAHDLYTELVVTHDSCDRGRYCLRVAADLMPSVASNLYLATFSSHYINQTRKQAVQIYTQFVTEMEEHLKTVSWLDANSMSEVTNKLRFMAIQFPPILDESQLDDSLGECSLTDMQYLKDSICLVKNVQVKTYSRYTLDPHYAHAMWPHFLTSFSTETIFIYGLNTYMVPQAVLREFDSQMPQNIVMARLGFILARGLAHNFDQTGVKYTAGGKFGQMLSEGSYPLYQDVVDTSNSLFSFTRSHKEGRLTYEYLLDPELTLNQRLSDITAANLAQISAAHQLADSQLLWVPFSPSQLFYIALAQSMCSKKKMPEVYTTLYEGSKLLPFVRVFNIASSSEKFALAFQCPQGAPMNLQDLMKTRPFPLLQTEEVDYL